MAPIVHAQATEILKWPHLIQLRQNFYVAAFSTMKLIPASYMLQKAIDRDLIHRKTTIVETTSGTFGLALAMVCAERGLKLMLVGDSAIDQTLASRIKGLGAGLTVVEKPAPRGGLQQARLEKLAVLREELSPTFWPAQYDNPDNTAAYGALAKWLHDRVGPIDCLVGTVGTGGSMCGTAGALQDLSARLRVIGVDTHGSVLFGQKDKPGRLVRGLGNSILPRNVDHRLFDEVHWVSAGNSFQATHRLYADHALFMGPTSGAAWLVADWWARHNTDRVVVAILPDDGHRYQSTVYSQDWLSEKGLAEVALDSTPSTVVDPTSAEEGWSRIEWGRRTYDEIVITSQRGNT